jgi:hypothetical protein
MDSVADIRNSQVLHKEILPASRTMALGSAQPLAEMSTRNLLGGGRGKGRLAHKAYVTAICEPIV